MKRVLAILGSAGTNSANRILLERIADLAGPQLEISIFDGLKQLPHFDPDQSTDNPPEAIADLRKRIADADGVLICTPEYVFSIPSGLKNAIEWCVATTVFSDKPVGLITASADGEKGHAELQLIMRTLYAKVTDEATLLIRAPKGKVDSEGGIDSQTEASLRRFVVALTTLVEESPMPS